MTFSEVKKFIYEYFVHIHLPSFNYFSFENAPSLLYTFFIVYATRYKFDAIFIILCSFFYHFRYNSIKDV